MNIDICPGLVSTVDTGRWEFRQQFKDSFIPQPFSTLLPQHIRIMPAMAWLVQRALRFLLPSDDVDNVNNLVSIFHHEVWRALQRGAAAPFRRPPLPAELVRIIIQDAGFKVPDRVLATTKNKCAVHSHGPRISKVWFWSGPLTRTTLAHIAALQLVTVSGDQGWASDRSAGSWSWFDIGIFPAPPVQVSPEQVAKPEQDLSKDRSEADESWASAEMQNYFKEMDEGRWHLSHSNPIADRSLSHREGRVFTMDDDLWQDTKPGDVIAVRMCAQFGGWANNGARADLRTWKYFEPVIPM